MESLLGSRDRSLHFNHVRMEISEFLGKFPPLTLQRRELGFQSLDESVRQNRGKGIQGLAALLKCVELLVQGLPFHLFGPRRSDRGTELRQFLHNDVLTI